MIDNLLFCVDMLIKSLTRHVILRLSNQFSLYITIL